MDKQKELPAVLDVFETAYAERRKEALALLDPKLAPNTAVAAQFGTERLRVALADLAMSEMDKYLQAAKESSKKMMIMAYVVTVAGVAQVLVAVITLLRGH